MGNGVPEGAFGGVVFESADGKVDAWDGVVVRSGGGVVGVAAAGDVVDGAGGDGVFFPLRPNHDLYIWALDGFQSSPSILGYFLD